MPQFVYKARNASLQTIEGEVFAETETEALARIDEMGCCPVWIREKEVEVREAKVTPLSERASHRDITVFTRQLAGLVKSGVPILRALRTVRDQSANPRFRQVVASLEETVREGRMLSEAMARHQGVFPDLYVSLVRSGESAGILDVILLRLAEARDKEEEVRKKLQAAMAYPMLVLIVGLITVFVMVTFFLPKITGFFRNFATLPLPTRILIHISDGFRHYWVWALVPIILSYAMFRRVTSGGKGRMLLDLFKLNLPIVGSFILESNIARFSRTMSLLINSGITIERSLALSAETMTSSVLKAEMLDVRRMTVHQGRPVAAGLKEAKHFPAYAQNMAAVGEESGRLDESMADVASFYEREVERRVAIATSLIEPLLILCVGGVVGFIVFAMMLPIFAMSQAVR